MNDRDDHPHRSTDAARMLEAGLTAFKRERGVSLRSLAKQLGYKQSVVLSHMASGRVPIPVDRAEEIARMTGLPVLPFVMAVLRQRFPGTSWEELLAFGPDRRPEREFATNLQALAGTQELTPDQQEVIEQVKWSARPKEQWASPKEAMALKLLRSLRPNLAVDGLSAADTHTISAALSRVDLP